jgi:hypothetical protein
LQVARGGKTFNSNEYKKIALEAARRIPAAWAAILFPQSSTGVA